MPNIVGVVFHKGGKVYDFDAGTLELVRGDQVVVETVRGTELGTVTVAPREAAEDETTASLKPVLRRATAQDLETVASHSALRTDALATCRKLIARHGLEMKLVDAEVMFGGGKVVFSFFAEERIDFRALVVDLAKALKMRIELRQIGVRDEARMFGGLGPCGRHLCCTLFQVDQEPVSIRMAKEQNLPLNPMKISGLCGRLMCCLKYEQEQYVSFRKEAPRRGTLVSCPQGEGVVAGYQVPKDSIVIKLEDGTFVEERADRVRIVGADRCGGEEIVTGGNGEEGEQRGSVRGDGTAADTGTPTIGTAATGTPAPEAPEVAMAAGVGLGPLGSAGVAAVGASGDGAACGESGGATQPGAAATELTLNAGRGAPLQDTGQTAVGDTVEAPEGTTGEGAEPGDLQGRAERTTGARSGGRGSRRSRRDRGEAERDGTRKQVAEKGEAVSDDRVGNQGLDEATTTHVGEESEESGTPEPGEKRRPRRRRRRPKSKKPGSETPEGLAGVDDSGTGGGSGQPGADD